MENIRLIGISGKKRSGKDTIAKILKRFLPEYEIKSYAYKLREICSVLTNKPIEFFLDDNNKPLILDGWDISVRYMLQKVGTDCFRVGLDEDAWVKSLFSSYSNNSKWIISDVRFENEVKAIHDRGGIVVRVNGDYDNNKNSQIDDHPSETALDNYTKFDYYINNNGTVTDLYKKVYALHHEFFRSI